MGTLDTFGHFWVIQTLQGGLEYVGLFRQFGHFSTSGVLLIAFWPYWPKMPKLPKIAQKYPIEKGTQNSNKFGGGGDYNCLENFCIFKGENYRSSNDHFLFILGLGEEDGVK